MQRRLTTIMAADMVGYSRLIEADEVGTLERQKSHRRELIDPAFTQYRGRIVKEMGDGGLVEFPSVVDAVQCAVDIQRAMVERNAGLDEARRIRYRVGINLGDVVVENDDLFGDGVNVAARLEQMAEPGGICISGTTFDHLKSQVDVQYASLGEVRVKNIAQPVRAYRVLIDAADPAARKAANRPAGRYWRIGAVAAALVVVALAGIWWLRGQPPRISTVASETLVRPQASASIAVLPFENIGNDPDQDYFVDGMTDDLITDLSKFSSLFVIARNSVFAYKDQNVEPSEIARALGVRYILNGSVRAAGGRIRINSRLIDTTSGGQIWAERFDREMGDIFALQDDVTGKIVSALALQLTPEEKGRLAAPGRETTPEAYDLYLRGVEALRRYGPESIEAPESILQARSYFLKALTIDPDYARAHAAMAYTYTASLTEKVDPESVPEALRYAEQALELDPTLPQGHFALAFVRFRQGQHEAALESARKAVESDPNYADGYATLALVLAFSGRGTEAQTAIEQAMHLNPAYAAPYVAVNGYALFAVGEYDEAIRLFRDCVSRDPAQTDCHAFLAASHGLTGHQSDAEWEAQEVLGLEPDFKVATNSISDQFSDPELRAKFQRGLKLAGIPE
jgi:adenylate cyclase